MAKKTTNKHQSTQKKQASPQPPVRHVAVPKKPRQWPAFLAVTWYATLAAARNRATLAFGFIFPLAFITVFGLLGNTAVSVNLGVASEVEGSPVVEAVELVEAFDVRTGNRADLEQELTQGELDALLVITEQDGGVEASARSTVTLYTSQASAQVSGAAVSIVQGIVSQLNLSLAGVTEPPIAFEQREVEGRVFRYIDFALPGMIGFALLGTALFGTVFGLIALKKTLVLKRLFATPTKPLTFLAAQGASRLIFALLQTALIVGVGVLAFQFYLPHGLITLLEMLVISSVGLVAFLGFGYFMAGFANDENSAGPLVNLVTLPQFLLSGTFFPTDSFPSWVQPIAHNLPLTYFNDAMRTVTTEGGNLTDTWFYLIGMLAWGAVMYYLASRTFRWE